MARVREQFSQLTGLEPDSVSGLAKVDAGWQFTIEVVEIHRVPDTASLLASYRVTTDDAGESRGTNACAATAGARPISAAARSGVTQQ
jgi:hypothetical protein